VKAYAFALWSLRFAFGSALLFAPASALSAADELKGAAAVLSNVAEQSAHKPDPAPPSEAAKLREELTTFATTGASLAPEQAAGQWLALVDRFLGLPAQARAFDEETEPFSAETVLAALPPPGAWDALSKAVNGRPPARKGEELREIGLRLLVAALAGDKPQRERELQALQARAENAPRSENNVVRSLFDRLSEIQLESADDPDAVLKTLERRLDRGGGRGRGTSALRLPNLIALVGEAKATVFLRQALTNSSAPLEMDDENPTTRLAQKLALEQIASLKAPQWSLVNSLEAVDLFEALDKKFTPAKPKAKEEPAGFPEPLSMQDLDGGYQRSKAETYYFLGLISHGRAKDAVAVAQKLAREGRPYLPEEALKAMERAGYTQALDDFFFELLSQDAALPYWDEAVQLAAKAGRTERMLKLARTAAADPGILKTKRSSIHQTLFRALLADGQVEEGVAEIRRLLAQDPSPNPGRETPRWQLGLALAKLGMLLNQPSWTEDGLNAARRSLTNANPTSWDNSSAGAAPALAEVLADRKQWADAESVLTEALASAVRALGDPDSFGSEPWGMARPLLAALASLYYRAGRSSEVIALLDSAPYWGARDASELLADDSMAYLSGMGESFSLIQRHVRTGPESMPLLHVAAAALADLNRTQEAQRLNDAVLSAHPGNDRGYELLLRIRGEQAEALLDELFARDPFEERPLIWKAKILADRKEFGAAETTVRRAIAIDPSDGEQGPGDRMRAYALLAEIREARGDAKEAAFFRGVIKAIRLSEEADAYYGAGLLKRAVAMYEESLKLFADAYCIQSRLAIQLAELGLHEQAAAHYRRAYELMPDSFGRVESHCFGCERVFAGGQAQSLAEKVFTELVAKQPRKPQVHYLLGYLRAEQGRHAEALPHFKTAVELDPEYINAWERLFEASSHVRMAATERDEIALNILRLDPLRRHAGADLARVSDLRRLWNAVEAARKKQPPQPASLYPLSASKAALDRAQSETRATRHGRFRYRSYVGRPSSLSPARAVAQTPYVQSVALLLNYQNYEAQ